MTTERVATIGTGAPLHSGLVLFGAPGVLCVVAGGLVAAFSASAPTEHLTWAAAYLVLVGGVAQVGLGVGQFLFAPTTPAPLLGAQLVGWNLGNAAVLFGTLTDRAGIVDVGGALLVVTLALLARGSSSRRTGPVTRLLRWLRYGYALLIILLLLSVPIGLLLARTRR